uniref:BUB1 N-terminal domain-containing protein n=1 Tax=Heterorhabditis bacteriophora TaxID=37862 RepID=A0A1I7XRD7_HETBA
MHVKQGYFLKRWRKAKTEILSSFLAKYRRCVLQLKKCLHESSRTDNERRKSHAKLHPLPDRPIRRVASKLGRKPTNELERLRKKGEDWNANDLFRFQYSDPESGTPEERRTLCFEWLDRLQAITKKYCYLAWYESAIYACYYRLAPILYDVEEKKRIWMDVKREYAEIFMMGRRIWRRPIHPSRLRVFYDMAMLCVRFGQIENDSTIMLFRDSLEDANNFDFKVLSEVEFAKSIDKISRLENHIIDQFYLRRRSSGSVRSSFRTRRNTDRSPSRRSENEDDSGEQPSTSVAQLEEHDPLSSSIEAISLAFDETTSHERPKSILIPSIVLAEKIV